LATVFTRARHWSLSCERWIQSTSKKQNRQTNQSTNQKPKLSILHWY